MTVLDTWEGVVGSLKTNKRRRRSQGSRHPQVFVLKLWHAFLTSSASGVEGGHTPHTVVTMCFTIHHTFVKHKIINMWSKLHLIFFIFFLLFPQYLWLLILFNFPNFFMQWFIYYHISSKFVPFTLFLLCVCCQIHFDWVTVSFFYLRISVKECVVALLCDVDPQDESKEQYMVERPKETPETLKGAELLYYQWREWMSQ